MKKISAVFIGLLAVLLSCHWAVAQTGSDVSSAANLSLSGLPVNLELKEDGPQKYSFVCDYFYLDPLGNLTGKEQVSAEYTRALPEREVRWNNVRVASAQGFEDPFPVGEAHQYMEGFSYRPDSSGEMFKNEFFKGFPATEMKTRNLVWDVYMFEIFAWRYFNKLKLNQVYALQSHPEDVPLAGAGTFQNHHIELTWIGVSQMNGEDCALLRYQAYFNKLKVTTPQTDIQGRSHYWGEIWVSLSNKQIEYGTLNEDVLVNLEVPGQSNKIIMNVFRKGDFKKMRATQ